MNGSYFVFIGDVSSIVIVGVAKSVDVGNLRLKAVIMGVLLIGPSGAM